MLPNNWYYYMNNELWNAYYHENCHAFNKAFLKKTKDAWIRPEVRLMMYVENTLYPVSLAYWDTIFYTTKV